MYKASEEHKISENTYWKCANPIGQYLPTLTAETNCGL